MNRYVIKLNSDSLNFLFSLIQNRDTLMQLSKNINVGYGTVRKWKAGKASIPYSIFCKIIKTYKLDKKSFKYEIFASKKQEIDKLKKWVSIQRDRSIRAKATKTLYQKYGNNYFKKIGLISAEKGYLTKRELEIHKINKTLPNSLESKSHFTINNANYDLVYFKNAKPIFAEEVLGGRKKKSSTLFQIAKIKEKSEKLGLPVIITSWYEQNFNTKTERFPLESILWMLETDSLIPVLLDVKMFSDFRSKLLSNLQTSSKKYLSEFCKKEIKKRYLLRGAKAEKNTPQNRLEKVVHDLFKKYGFAPTGKKMIETKYNTYFVIDDFVPKLNAAVMVTSTSMDDVIGQSFGLKTMCEDKIVTIGILENESRYRKYKYERIKNKYVDHLFVGMKELEEWLRSMGS